MKVIRIVKLLENYIFIRRKNEENDILLKTFNVWTNHIDHYGTIPIKKYYGENYEPSIHYSNYMFKNAYEFNFGNFTDQI